VGQNYSLGQSLTTPTGGLWDNISFNFIDSTGNPYANGTLFLLTQEYLGTPGDLGSSTAGYLAASMSSAGGIWDFAPSVLLQGNTTYWFYMNTWFDDETVQLRYGIDNSLYIADPTTDLPLSLYGGGSYQADTAATSSDGTENFYASLIKGTSFDLAFTLTGTVNAPEPATLPRIALGLVMVWFGNRKRA